MPDLTKAGRVLVAPAIAALLATIVAAPAAMAEIRDFTCTGDQLGRRVVSMPTTFLRSASTATSQTFIAQPQVRRPGDTAPTPVETRCDLAYDLYHFDNSGKISPIAGEYRLTVQCEARPAGRSAGRGMQLPLAVPAPSSGGPFDPPAMRAKLAETACRAARNAIFTATSLSR